MSHGSATHCSGKNTFVPSIVAKWSTTSFWNEGQGKENNKGQNVNFASSRSNAIIIVNNSRASSSRLSCCHLVHTRLSRNLHTTSIEFAAMLFFVVALLSLPQRSLRLVHLHSILFRCVHCWLCSEANT